MGCFSSKIERQETLQRCKERKKLMKQLLSLRDEFAHAQLSYLQSLKNTGVTLRQFTEVESLEIENDGLIRSPLPRPLPPPPLPPSPPPPPPYSPTERFKEEQIQLQEEECIEIDDDDSCTPPPPPIHSSTWEFWDPFGPSSSPLNQKKNVGLDEMAEEEDWAETNTEFEEQEEVEEEQEKEENVGDIILKKSVLEKSPPREMTVDDNSSIVSWYTKETDMPMVVWRSKKTLAGIVKELDDYFLKASAAGRKEIGVLLVNNQGRNLYWNFGEKTKSKFLKSPKVFSALSWSWSSKSLQPNTDAVEFHGTSEVHKPSGLSMTLDKLYSEEKLLYEKIKEEATARLQHEKKTLLLQKQEAQGDQDWMKTEKLRSTIENLQCEISCLQQSINRSCSDIVKLRDEELHPQLIELSSGLMLMWRTMYECHQVQNHIAQQMSHLNDHPSTEPTTEYHRQATAQLETEVNSWYNAFCNLLSFQRDYVHTLNDWVKLTGFLTNNPQTDSSSRIQGLCEEWQLALDRLPDKVASESLKNFSSVIHSIVLQQEEERSLQKKSIRLEKKLEKELNLLSKMEKKFNLTLVETAPAGAILNHPLSIKRAKTDVLEKRVEEEKAKYLNSVRVSRAMTMNNLMTSFPNVFQALTGFSSVCAQAFEVVRKHAESTGSHDDDLPSYA